MSDGEQYGARELPMDVVARLMQYMSFRDLSRAAIFSKLWKEQAAEEKVRFMSAISHPRKLASFTETKGFMHMQGKAVTRAAAQVSWAKSPSSSPQWVLDACYSHEKAFGKPCECLPSKPQGPLQQTTSTTPATAAAATAATAAAARHVCVIGAKCSGRSSLLEHLATSIGLQHNVWHVNPTGPGCCCPHCYSYCWDCSPHAHASRRRHLAECCPMYHAMGEAPSDCRYRRIIDQACSYTPWYPKSHNSLLTKTLTYIYTCAAAVVLVVTALPVGTTATACCSNARRQATALRHLLPSHTPLILAVTRSDLAQSDPNPGAAFCDYHWQQLLKMTGGKIPSGNIMCGCNQSYDNKDAEQKQTLFAAASVPKAEKQQLLQGYRDLAGSLGLLYVEVDGTSSSSMEQLWQKVAAVASDGVNGACSSSSSTEAATSNRSWAALATATAAAGGLSAAPDGANAATDSSAVAGSDAGELCSVDSSSSRGRSRISPAMRCGPSQTGSWAAGLWAAIAAVAEAVVGGSSSANNRGRTSLSDGMGNSAGASDGASDQGGSDSNHPSATAISIISSRGSSSSSGTTGLVGGVRPAPEQQQQQQEEEEEEEQQQQEEEKEQEQQQKLVCCKPHVSREDAVDAYELLYDACGASPDDLAGAAIQQGSKARSAEAVLGMAGWMVLPLDPNKECKA